MNAISRTLVAMAAFVTAAGIALPASAAKVNCKPDVQVTNGKQAAIKVVSFLYKIEGSPETKKEGLANKNLAKNEVETWRSQSLNFAANGVVITSSAVEYRDDNSGSGGGYGPLQTSDWHDHTFKCGGNHTYKQTVR